MPDTPSVLFVCVHNAGRPRMAAAFLFPGRRYLDRKLDDPAGQGGDAIRPIRDEIEQRIRGLLAEPGIQTAA